MQKQPEAAVQLIKNLELSPLDTTKLAEQTAPLRATGDWAGLLELLVSVGSVVPDATGIRVVWDHFATVLAEMANSEADPWFAAQILGRAASIRSNYLSEPVVASELLRTAFGRFPNVETVDQLVGLLDRTADRETVSDLLALRVSLVPEGPQKAAALAVLGHHCLDIGLADEAERHFFSALEVDIECPGAVSGIERVDTFRSARKRRIQSLREAAQRARSDKERGASLIRLGDALAEPGLEVVGETILAELEHTYGEAFKLIPTADTLDKLADVLNYHGNRDALAALYMSALDDNAPDALRFRVHRGLGVLFCEQGPEKVDEARLHLQKAMLIEPNDAEVLTALAVVFRASEQWLELAQTLDKLRSQTRSKQKERELLEELADIRWRRLRDMEGSERIYRRLRSQDPRNLDALGFYEEYYREKQDWRRLYGTLAQKFAIVDEVQRRIVAREMAELAENEMASPEKAIEAWRRVVDLEPGNALAGMALAAALAETGKWHALLELHNAAIDAAEAVGDTATMLERLEALLQVYTDPDKLPIEEMAYHTRRRIADIAPQRGDVLDALAGHYEERGLWRDLAAILERRLATLSSDDEKSAYRRRVADVWMKRLGNESAALPHLEAIVAEQPNEIEAIRALQRIYRSKRDITRLYEAYLAELNLTSGVERKPILAELATLATQSVTDLPAAIRYWEEVTAIDPGDEKARQQLEELYAGTGRWDLVVQLLQARLKLPLAKRKRAEILEKIGTISADYLGDIEGAKLAFVEVTELSPYSVVARKRLQQMHEGHLAGAQLESIYAEKGDWKGYIRLLEDTLRTEADEHLQIELNLEIARIYSERLEDSLRAMRHLDRVLELDPAHVAVARLLVPLAEAKQNNRKLASLLEVIATYSDDEQEVLTAVARLVELAVRRRDNSVALFWLCRQFELQAVHGRLGDITTLESFAEKSNDYEMLANAYAGAVAALSRGTEESLTVTRHLARVLKEKLRRYDDAKIRYFAVLDVSPSDLEAMAALQDIFLAVRDWDGLEDILWRRVSITEDPVETRDVLLKLGELYESVLMNPERAVDVFSRMRAIDPKDEEASEGLKRTFELEERWSELLEVLVSELELQQGVGQEQSILLEMAEIHDRRLHERDKAVDVYSRVLELDPKNEMAIGALVAMLDDRGRSGPILTILERPLREIDDPERLGDWYARRIALEEDEDARIELSREYGYLLESRMFDAEAAYPLLLQVASYHSHDLATWLDAERAAVASGQTEDWIEWVAAATGVGGDGRKLITPLTDEPTRLELLRRQAQYLEDRARLSEAILCYEEVLGATPSDPDVLSALERLYLATNDWECLLLIGRKLADMATDSFDRKAVFVRMGKVLEDRVERPGDAINVYSRALALDGSDDELISALDRLFTNEQRWEELVDLLRRKLSLLTDPAEMITVYLRLADILSAHIADPVATTDALVAVLRLDPGNIPALDQLETLVHQRLTHAPAQINPADMDVLRARLVEGKHWERVVLLDEIRVEFHKDPVERARIFAGIGDIYASVFQDTAETFTSYARAVLETPTNQTYWDLLFKLSDAQNYWDKTLSVLEDAILRLDPDVAVPLRLHAARIVTRMGDNRRAVEHLEAARRVQPDNVNVLEQLDGAYSKVEIDPEPWAKVKGELARYRQGDEQARTILEMARLYVSADDLPAARTAFEAVRDAAGPGDLAGSVATKELIGVYEAQGDWVNCATALEETADRTTDLAEQSKLLLRAAEIRDVQLKQPDDALILLHRVDTLGILVDDVSLGIERILENKGAWSELLAHYRHEQERSTPDVRRCVRAGSIAEQHLTDWGAAASWYEAALSLDSESAEVAGALTRLMECPDPVVGFHASELLLLAFELHDDVRGLLDTYSGQITHFSNRIDVKRRHLDIAELLEVRLDDLAGAWEHVGMAWKLSPQDDDVWADWVRLTNMADCWDRLIDWVTLARSEIADSEVRISCFSRLVKVFRHTNPNPTYAESAIKLLLEEPLEPHEEREVLDDLEQIYSETEAWQPLIDVLRHKAESSGDVSNRIALNYQMAAIFQANLGQDDRALELYENILSMEPSEIDALLSMETIYRRRDAWEAAADVLRRLATLEHDVELNATIKRRLLEIVGLKLQNIPEALELSRQLLEWDATDDGAVSVLTQLQTIAPEPNVWVQLIPALDARGDWSQLASTLEQATTACPGHSAHSDWLARLVDVYDNVLNTPDLAYETGKRYVRATTSMSSVLLLRKIAEKSGQLSDLVIFLEEMVDGDSPEFGVSLLKEIAEIRERVLDDPEGAAALYERLLADDSQVQVAAEALERLYRRLGRFEELGDLFEHLAVTAADESLQLLLYLKAANIWDDTVSLPDRAEAMLLQVLARRPDEPEALQRLERVYLRTQEFEKLAALYERWPAENESTDRRAELLFKQAFLLANQLVKPAQAVLRLRDALQWVPNYPPAVRFLEALLEQLPSDLYVEGEQARLVVADLLSRSYDDTTDWERQVKVCEARLSAPMETVQRVDVLLRLAKLLRTFADDTESAFLRLAEALLLAPEREDVRALTAGVAEGAGLLTDLRDLYLEVAAAEPRQTVAYTLWAAELVEDHLGNEDAARSLYERVLQLAPGNNTALNALERYYSVRGTVRGVIDILQHRLLNGPVENRAAQLLRLGQLQEEAGLTGDAIESYRASLNVDPQQPMLVDLLLALYLKREDWAPYVQMLQLKLESQTDPSSRSDLLSRLAHVYEKNLSQPEEAARCLQAIFSENPGNLYAISGLERLYPQISAWEPLLEILNHKRGMLANPRDRVVVDFQVAQIYHLHLGDFDKALDYYRLVLARDEQHQGTITALENLLDNDQFRFSTSLILEGVYEQIGEWRKLAHLHRAQLPYLNDIGEKVDLYLRAAAIQEERLYDPDEAISVLASALRDGLVPAVLRDKMIEIAERHDRWDSLVFSVGALVDDVADADASREINLWLAQINENKLFDMEAAIERYRRVLDFDENHPIAIAALERLLDQEGRFDELGDLWRSRLAAGSKTDQRSVIQLRLADLLAEQLGEPLQAVEILRDIVWEVPDSEDAHERLERIATLEPSCRVDIVDMLEPIYRQQKRWRNLVHLFELRIESAETRADRARWATSTADVLVHQLREPERALDYYLAALINAPSEAIGRMDVIESTAVSLDRLSDLADALDRVLVDTSLETRRADVAVRAAALYGERLNDIRKAEELLKLALDADPVHARALDALDRLYESTGRHAEHVEICERKIRLPLSFDEKKRVLFRLGDSARSCRQEQRAIDAFRQILAMDPKEARALRRLESIFEKTGDLASLADVLERQSTTADAWTPEIIAVKLRLAKIKETELQDSRAAIEVYEEILDHDPAHGESLHALERLFRQMAMWDQLREVLEKQLQIVTTPVGRTALYVRLAKLYEHELDDLDTAVRIYEGLLDNDSENVEALNELVRLMHKHSRWEDLASLYEQKLAKATNLSDKTALLLRSAELYDKHLDNSTKALECLRAVLNDDPQNRLAMQHVAMIRERHGDWQDAVQILETLLESTQEPKVRVGILVKLGGILLERANDTRQAQQYLLQAVRLDPDDRDANEALRRLYIARESWEALLEILQRQLRWATEAADKAAKCREIALVYRDQLRNDGRFVQWIEEAHEIDPNDAVTVEELVKIADEDADQERLVPLLKWLVQHHDRLRNYNELPSVAHRLGQVYEGLGDDKKAMEYYRLAYRHDATYLPGLLSLGRLLLRTGELEQARGVYQAMQLQPNTADTEVKVETFYNLGLICRLLDDPRRAKQYFQRVLRIDKDHGPTLAELAALDG